MANPIYQSVSSKTLAHVQHCQSSQRKISSNFQRADFQVVPLVCFHYTATGNTEEAEVEYFYEDLQDLLELTPKKDVLFITGDWTAIVGIKRYLEYWANLAQSREKGNSFTKRMNWS